MIIISPVVSLLDGWADKTQEEKWTIPSGYVSLPQANGLHTSHEFRLFLGPNRITSSISLLTSKVQFVVCHKKCYVIFSTM